MFRVLERVIFAHTVNAWPKNQEDLTTGDKGLVVTRADEQGMAPGWVEVLERSETVCRVRLHTAEGTSIATMLVTRIAPISGSAFVDARNGGWSREGLALNMALGRFFDPGPDGHFYAFPHPGMAVV